MEIHLCIIIFPCAIEKSSSQLIKYWFGFSRMKPIKSHWWAGLKGNRKNPCVPLWKSPTSRSILCEISVMVASLIQVERIFQWHRRDGGQKRLSLQGLRSFNGSRGRTEKRESTWESTKPKTPKSLLLSRLIFELLGESWRWSRVDVKLIKIKKSAVLWQYQLRKKVGRQIPLKHWGLIFWGFEPVCFKF